MRKLLAPLLVILLGSVTSLAAARAPDTWEEDYEPPVNIESPMWMALEIKTGPYQPHQGRAFKRVFGDDQGWMLSLEVDVTLYHIPWVGQLDVGGGWGWANYDAKALTDTGRAGEETKFTVYPLSALAILRIDALARHTVVPLQFAAKIGYDWVRWKAETGSRTDGTGFNRGLRWGVQAAFELDFFDRNTARRLDEDWGVNHTFLLAEYYKSKTEGTGDDTFSIGVGATF